MYRLCAFAFFAVFALKLVEPDLQRRIAIMYCRSFGWRAQKSLIVSPPFTDKRARHVARTMLSFTNRTEPSASTTCTPPACRLREAQVSFPVAAETHGRN